jgi:isocitrate/isopropylmalate dehydrogenase
MTLHKVTLIQGDGIGPEICRATQEIIQASGVEIEWEELPSLTGALRRSEFVTTRGSVWHSTERMDLAPLEPEAKPAPFVEAVEGLLVREIAGDEVFKHFFGDPTANH